MTEEERLNAEVTDLMQKLSVLRQRQRQLEREKLPPVKVGSYWKSRLMDATYQRVERVEYDIAFCSIVYHHTNEGGREIGSVTWNHPVNVNEFGALEKCGAADFLAALLRTQRLCEQVMDFKSGG